MNDRKLSDSPFALMMRRADKARRQEHDLVKRAWWTGYMHGLRYAESERTGEHLYRTKTEHDLYIMAYDLLDVDPEIRALGRGYLDGLTLTEKNPEE